MTCLQVRDCGSSPSGGSVGPDVSPTVPEVRVCAKRCTDIRMIERVAGCALHGKSSGAGDTHTTAARLFQNAVVRNELAGHVRRPTNRFGKSDPMCEYLRRRGKENQWHAGAGACGRFGWRLFSSGL